MDMNKDPDGISRVCFYELYACSVCRYTEENIGACYAYCHNGLICVGATKPQVASLPEYYFDLLSKGISFGEAFRRTLDSTVHRGYIDDFSFTTLGAATLRFTPYYPDTYASVTTPVQKLDFGYVSTGGHATKKMILTNKGTQTAEITEVSSSNALFAFHISVPFTIPAKDSIEIVCTFSPSLSKEDSGTISVVSNASDYPRIDIPVYGKGIDLTPHDNATLQLFMTHGGNPDDQNISPNMELVNNRNEPVALSSIRIDYGCYQQYDLFLRFQQNWLYQSI